jgi:hypothetical protein
MLDVARRARRLGGEVVEGEVLWLPNDELQNSEDLS